MVLLLFSLAACKRRPSAEDAPKEVPAQLVSSIEMADSKGAAQLTRGFHALEGNSWRWTESRFSVILAPPAGASERGARLVLKLNLPEAVVSRSGPVTLSASFNGESLKAETFAKAGEYVYARDIDAREFGPSAAAVEFAIDKFLPAGTVDGRELGLIVSSVSLEAK